MIYQWKPESRIKLDPQAAGEELERLRVWNNGRLESPAVVDASRDPGSPLHSYFEWNDTRAAERYREEQAGYLIRMITIEVAPEEDRTPIRAFVSVKRDEDRSYTSTVHALADPELRTQVVAQAFKELEAWRKRHAELVEFAAIFATIDQARPA